MIMKLAQALDLLEEWGYELPQVEGIETLAAHVMRAKVEIAKALAPLVIGSGQQAAEELAKVQK